MKEFGQLFVALAPIYCSLILQAVSFGILKFNPKRMQRRQLSSLLCIYISQMTMTLTKNVNNPNFTSLVEPCFGYTFFYPD